MYLPNDRYHQFMENWETSDVDLIYSFAGKRLQQQIGKDQIQSLNHLWVANNWKEQFGNLRSIIGDEYNVFALPLSYYQWGFYYKKSAFDEIGMPPPNTWDDLLSIAYKLRAKERYTFVFPGRSGWMAASWFSYLNLRINGLEFHHSLLNGEVSYHSVAVKKVFTYWSEILADSFFDPGAKNFDLREALPLIYRQRAVMMLSGNFITKHARTEFRDQIGYFPFPIIDSEIPIYEEAPTDVLFMRKDASNKKAAELFLQTLASPENLLAFNETVGYISPNALSDDSEDPFIRQGAQVLRDAKATTQYFDRDSKLDFAEPAMKVLAEFMETADIKATINDLDKLRIETNQ